MIELGTKVEDLETPCVVIDIDRMESNIQSWQDAISASGTKLRPHVKTHKVPEIGRLQLHAGAVGITVSKVSEAEVFADNGFADIFIAYPVIGASKWKRVADLAKQAKVIVGCDSELGVRGLSRAAVTAGSTILMRVEVDTGLHRAGVPMNAAEALCRLVPSLPGLELDGIFTFRSVLFADARGRPIQELGREEGEGMVAIADQLRARGLEIREVSVGSTPTAREAAKVPGVTEVRPGSYIFSDYLMTELGANRYDQVALSVWCTVVSRQTEGKATIDGGSKTFGGDLTPASLNALRPDTLNLPGYAMAVGIEAYLEGMSEEHGVIRLGRDADPQVGDRIALHPIHGCTTVNLCNELIGVRNGVVEKVWPVLARGMRT